MKFFAASPSTVFLNAQDHDGYLLCCKHKTQTWNIREISGIKLFCQIVHLHAEPAAYTLSISFSKTSLTNPIYASPKIHCVHILSTHPACANYCLLICGMFYEKQRS
ncbi:hypothetical protein ABZP36_011931 [Zizania latifolia]